MKFSVSRWLKISLYNFLIVSVLGVLLRYKIAFNFPFVEQKFLLHGHSHFAFAGWITQTLMVLMVAHLSRLLPEINLKGYKWILIANLITAYGMLLSFPFQGYGSVSITCSTLSVFTFYIFGFYYWVDLNKVHTDTTAHKWLKAAILYNLLSSLGTFMLAYLMMNKMGALNLYLADIYYYLHFQYNGWFFFACMGLFHHKFERAVYSNKKAGLVFWLFALACIPAYFLSILWMKVPLWLTIIIIMASTAQVLALVLFLKNLFRHTDAFSSLSAPVKWLWLLSGIALSIKLLLQFFSTYPALSKLAFGYRPIVIAYLHLVLLGMISFFLVGYIFQSQGSLNKRTVSGILVFIAGVCLNELVLMVQGLAGFGYIAIPYVNQALFGISLILFCGIGLIAISYKGAEETSGL